MQQKHFTLSLPNQIFHNILVVICASVVAPRLIDLIGATVLLGAAKLKARDGMEEEGDYVEAFYVCDYFTLM
jgi:hypothetical protein